MHTRRGGPAIRRPRSSPLAARSRGMAVLDLAAGTGKLTRALAAGGATVIAVEPVAEMRAALPDSVTALDGTAEAIPLEDGSVDLVTVAQAFHWFDGPAALAEIHRVLEAGRPARRPVEPPRGGRPGQPRDRGADRAVPHGHAHPQGRRLARGLRARRPCSGRSRRTSSRTSRCSTRTGWRRASARSASSRGCPRPERAALLARARELTADGPVTVPYRTEVHVCDAKRA